MEENIETIIDRLDFNELYEQEVGLRTTIGNDSSRAILQAYVDQYFNEKIAGLNPQISPILLIGGKNSSVHVMARAISNSFGNLNLQTVTAKWLNDNVITLHGFFAEGLHEEFSAFYIDGDKLNSNNQLQLSKILKEKKIFYYNFESQSWEKRPFENRLIILSTSNKDEIPHILLQKFKVQVNLKPLNASEIELALRQRIKLLNISVSSPDLVSKIAQCCSDIGQAIELLVMSQRICRNQNKETITEANFNLALTLLDKNMRAAGQKSVG